jgi:hypothetical protein
MGKDIYHILTNLTVILHLLFMLFVVVGGFFARRKRWMTIVHMAAVAWGIYAELATGVICPLTTLENYFAYLAGMSTYQEDFITRYLVPVIYQDSLTPAIQFALVGIVVLLNVIAYKSIWKRFNEWALKLFKTNKI